MILKSFKLTEYQILVINLHRFIPLKYSSTITHGI